MSDSDRSDCLFCKISDGKIPARVVYRDERVIAFEDIKPHAPLHLLVIPTRHIARLSEAVPEDAEVFGALMVTAARLAREAGHGDNGFRVVMNSGPAAGQTVFHVHLHLLGGRALAWPPG
ncbi:MAG: histidine triad nucleotide-binding protein [Pseudomonadota bacterium]